MSIVSRVQNILMKPAAEWDVIANEPATVSGLFTGYAAILAAIPAVMAIIFTGVLGIGGAGAFSIGLSFVVGSAVVGYIMSLVMLYVMSLIVNAVSPSFNGKSDMVQATKLMAYASTPVWVAGLITWINPFLAILIALAAVGYVVYLIYLGLPAVLAVPQEKVAGFTVVIVLVYIVLYIVLMTVVTGVVMTTFFGGAMMAGAIAGA